MKVIGIKRQKGNYEGRDYDNFILYLNSDRLPEGTTIIAGYCSSMTVKVKSSVMFETVNPDQVQNLLGHDLDFYYDSYKNVCKVLIKG